MTTDNRYRDAALIFILSMLVLYALAAFVVLEINPLNWTRASRAMYAFAGALFSAWLAGAYLLLRGHNDY